MRLLIQSRKSSLGERKPPPPHRAMKQNTELHEFLERQILTSAAQNKTAEKYLRKQGISSYLKNPALYNKLLATVTRRKLSERSTIIRQFSAHENKKLARTVDPSGYIGFK